ncbi:hypothetical protein CONPUDRAFT_73045 [Coniophora puteana RWD-64-598 SS2]|uniref:Uncharacterized protein n=1 Tax=Coniophora puteana (strain RWD-64-598) TaxID=741705 RepID=A0A5M3MQ09_CONPW|nr:uncharacterized protein CONPUDRAFT_73045 [Coniophora puteana RWD-64-598 SS2]EIW81268.1 hypothetical protein CONPUDRAFT_73045 [Coniophora puteana RWD-64-598 SS2]
MYGQHDGLNPITNSSRLRHAVIVLVLSRSRVVSIVLLARGRTIAVIVAGTVDVAVSSIVITCREVEIEVQIYGPVDAVALEDGQASLHLGSSAVIHSCMIQDVVYLQNVPLSPHKAGVVEQPTYIVFTGDKHVICYTPIAIWQCVKPITFLTQNQSPKVEICGWINAAVLTQLMQNMGLSSHPMASQFIGSACGNWYKVIYHIQHLVIITMFKLQVIIAHNDPDYLRNGRSLLVTVDWKKIQAWTSALDATNVLQWKQSQQNLLFPHLYPVGMKLFSHLKPPALHRGQNGEAGCSQWYSSLSWCLDSRNSSPPHWSSSCIFSEEYFHLYIYTSPVR